jgi:biopolymer transport protein ExbB/TolQ
MDRLREFLVAGGIVMLPIAAASLWAWGLALNAWIRVRELRGTLEAAVDALLGRRGPRVAPRGGLPAPGIPEFERLNARLRMLGVLVGLLPLLGLLGTVVGMLGTFQTIRGYGTGEPRLLAAGIRQALITTEAGLLLALPLLVLHRVLSARGRRAETSHTLLLHALEAEGARAEGRFGEIAVRLGYAGASDVEEAPASGMRIGQDLVRRGVLTPLQRRVVLALKGEPE